MRTSKTLLTGVLFAAALHVGACSSDPENPGTTGDPSTSDTAGGGGGGNPGQDECLLGTWQVDVQDLADQVMGLMAVPGASADTDGTITVEFAEDVTVTYDNTLTINMPIGDNEMVGNAVYSGSTGITDWTAADGVLEGQPGDHNVNVDMEFSAGGVTVPATIPPPDLSGPGPGATYTCSGDSATVAGPSPAPTWRLTRV